MEHKYAWVMSTPTGMKGWVTTALLVAAMVVGLQWSAEGAQLSAAEFAAGLPQIADFLSRTFPPDWSILGNLVAPAVETIQIAIWGTVLAKCRVSSGPFSRSSSAMGCNAVQG